MNLCLVKLESKYRHHLTKMLDDWLAVEPKEDFTPWAVVRNDYHDFDHYLANLEIKDCSGGFVPDSTFFCLDLDRDLFVGAVNIRHHLNERLLRCGGHIGDGVLPSERGKGIGTKMVALALDECRKLGLGHILMVCDKENIPSARTIQKNGGVLENEIIEDGVIEQRYWIDL